ncbi:MAG: nucleotide exchange factor GrpE [Candidatus Yanofskybacteria bacterium CG10_big_fil_rev_8_21_14_0_10_37_15]|uniref:Protein GrpE n=1 Tax=Candidatus Yanofskybacteria bacterium CG10_big_fil_rev_8_21_14_0_10_37_15 TaxID=1975097 RepID=A0A2H0R5H1_9BACT|nr:MAG: nucleotide exchange factor GrpE [Candidatus Yanofskybacteria bacterium CG10_big_fil_rev_8_21_14_0_10_37_15]
MDEENKKQPEVESKKTEIHECREDEYLNNWKRERADFLNYKKDEFKRLSEFAKFANEGILLEMIELLDDLETASREIEDHGLKQIVKKFEDFLKKHDVEKIDSKDKFDPLLHEATSTEEDGSRLEEVRAGYLMHGKVIRPARVKIVK